MSQAVVALLALAALVSLGQWLWAHTASHVDLRLMPAHSRRRVQWLLSNSTHIQVLSAVLAVAAIGSEAALVLS